MYEYHLNKEHYLCIGLDDLRNIINRFHKKQVTSFYFAYFQKEQKIALYIEKKIFYLNLLDYTPAKDEIDFIFNLESYAFKIGFSAKDLTEIILDESIFSNTLYISYDGIENTLEFTSSLKVACYWGEKTLKKLPN